MNGLQILVLFTVIALFLNFTVHYLSINPSRYHVFTLNQDEKPTLKRFIRNINEPYTPILSMEQFDYENTPSSSRRPIFPFLFEKSEPLVSIITTYYNLGNIIRETAISIQKQTFKNIEWIVVDDGSKDISPLKDLKKDFDFNMVVLKQNVGLPGARNAGIENSKGKYYVFLDADDLIEPTFIEKCVWFLETHPSFSFVNTYSVAFENNRYLHLLTHQRNSQELIKKNLFPVTSMIRASVMKEVDNFDASLRIGMEDWDLILKLHEKGHCGYTIEEVHFWYRIHKDLRWKQDEKGSDLKAKFLLKLKERYPLVFEKGIPKCLEIEETIPSSIENTLIPSKTSVLVMLNNLNVNAENQYHLEMIEQMSALDYHFIVLSTSKTTERSIEPLILKSTVDVFDLTKFLHGNHEYFIEYIIKSRKVQKIIVSHSEMGYKTLQRYPNLSKIEIIHYETSLRKDYMKYIDFTITTTQYLSSKIPEAHSSTIYYGIEPSLWNKNNVVVQSNVKDPVVSYIIQTPDIDTKFISLIQKIPKLQVYFIVDMDKDRIKNSNIGQRLMEISKEFGTERIQLLPIQEKLDDNFRVQRLIMYLSASDFIYIPSNTPLDPWIFKSLALETIILGELIKGRNEIVMEPFGILVNYSQPLDSILKEFHSKIQPLLDNPNLRIQVQKQAREIIEKVNTEEMVLFFQTVFKSQHLK